MAFGDKPNFGSNPTPTTPTSNLTAALQGSLDIITTNPESPLTEVTPVAIDLLLERINSAFVEGLPEKVTDDDLLQIVRGFRAEALHWAQEEQVKKPRAKKTPKNVLESIIIEIDI